MKIIIIVLTGLLYYLFDTDLALSQALTFQIWARFHHKKYSDWEIPLRKSIFQETVRQILRHNLDLSQSYRKGLNSFADLTQSEFITKVLGEYVPVQTAESFQNDRLEDIDWTTAGILPTVKNQGQCGSAMLYAYTQVIQAYCNQINKSRTALSSQQLIDCSGAGCQGGLISTFNKYILAQGGLATQISYPSTGSVGKCKNISRSNCKVNQIKQAKGCQEIDAALRIRPSLVLVDATKWATYSSGIFNNCQSNLNHAVLLVGSNSDSWKLMNSWGTAWGEKGFIRLAKGNTCGVCTSASYPN